MSANELDMKVDQIRELKRLIEEAEAEITSIGHLEGNQHYPD